MAVGVNELTVTYLEKNIWQMFSAARITLRATETGAADILPCFGCSSEWVQDY